MARKAWEGRWRGLTECFKSRQECQRGEPTIARDEVSLSRCLDEGVFRRKIAEKHDTQKNATCNASLDCVSIPCSEKTYLI